MASFKAVILPTSKRADGKYLVYIRLTHNRQSAYLKTAYYVSRDSLNQYNEIINQNLLEATNVIIKRYNDKLYRADATLSMSLERLVQIATAPDPGNEYAEFNLLKYFTDKVDLLATVRSAKTIEGYRVMLDSVRRYADRSVITPEMFSARFLSGFEAWLRIPKKRASQKKLVSAGNTTIHLYMSYLKALTRMAINELNTETVTVIRLNPFSKYKMPGADAVRSRALEIDDIRAIRDYQPTGHRAELARDVAMISFYLCGMNVIDIYKCAKPKRGVITYYRSKTTGRRKDSAMLSIVVQPELVPLLDKYRSDTGAFSFSSLYGGDYRRFFEALRHGFASMASDLNIRHLTSYYIRHSWATIARNECGIAKDDVHLALNHAHNDITDRYIQTDWSRVDKANRAVLDKVNGTVKAMKVV